MIVPFSRPLFRLCRAPQGLAAGPGRAFLRRENLQEIWQNEQLRFEKERRDVQGAEFAVPCQIPVEERKIYDKIYQENRVYPRLSACFILVY